MGGEPVNMVMPVPCLNVINGGVHAGNKLAFQEFFLIPSGAASFAEEKMQNFLTRSSAFKGKDLVKALRQAFHDCETEFIQIAGREGLRDGTTAVVALVQDDTLTVAHVGGG